MDFLKAMLVYMSITFAGAVNSAVPATVTPVPDITPAPTAVVTTLTPAEAAVTNTVTPQATETPVPDPTITPNKGYKVLNYGAKGADVKKLQQRLKDLGYLSGNVDGAFGYQTKRAVMNFQKYNGLTQDGSAGSSTLTRLYEDPNVVPNPESITPSPVPTSTPDPEGNVPLEEDPVAIWAEQSSRVLLNGSFLEKKITVYERGTQLMLPLQELCEAAGWTCEAADASTLSLQAVGYQLQAEQDALAVTEKDADGNVTHCERYTVTVDGAAMACEQGDVVFYNGAWYLSDQLLANAFHANITLDKEEKTLILQILESHLADAVD